MTEQITIDIAAKGVSCGDCKFFQREQIGYTPDMCGLFHEDLGLGEEGDGVRCKECLDSWVRGEDE